MIEGINSPAPQPEDQFQNAGPGYDEDPDVGIELEERVFYRACREGLLVAIVADYPGLIPSSHVSISGHISSKEKIPNASLPTVFYHT